MSNNLPHLPLGHYELTFRAGADLSLPAYPRGLWHGVFGLNLKRIAWREEARGGNDQGRGDLSSSMVARLAP